MQKGSSADSAVFWIGGDFMIVMRHWLIGYGMNESLANVLSSILLIAIVTLLCILVTVITKQILLRLIANILKKHFIKFQQFLIKRKVFLIVSHFAPALIIYWFAPAFPTFQKLIQVLAVTYLTIVTVTAISRLLSACNDVYQTYEISKTKPIKGYIQVIKIVVIIIAVILTIAKWMDKSPVILLSGIGALSAVFLLVFRDSLLGLVAGIQLSSTDMVRVGDWIEMPDYKADGDVIDISLNTVMVRNFDWTVTMIPSYALISSSFKNWRGMQELGGRRIMRSLFIDVTSIKSCSSIMIERFKKIDLLKEYITKRETEISAYNASYQTIEDASFNGRGLTNIGVFREYITQCLLHHPDIFTEELLMVRQLAPGQDGLPLEIYAFTKTIDVTVHEKIQADLFDHLFAIAAHFEIRMFQNPTGQDIKWVKDNSGGLDGIQRDDKLD